MLWTYAGLWEDFTGSPDGGRKAVVSELLGGLRHPQGTHVFWPFACPEPSASLFWSGVELFRPRVIILFGSAARDVVGLPGSLVPFGWTRFNGRLFIQLRRIADYVGREQDIRSVQTFLDRQLRYSLRLPR